MAAGFDARKDSNCLRTATRSFVESLLAQVMPDIRLAARGVRYAIAVHGSLSRDIDLLAVPWVEDCEAPEHLCDRICGALAGKLGRAAMIQGELTPRPHGRISATIITAGAMMPEIDLSVIRPLSIKEAS